jgi:hypothetical protein
VQAEITSAKWPTVRGEGMRAARLFAIPRPIQAKTPPMHGGPEGILDGACGFWKRVCSEYGIGEGMQFFTGGDDAAEEFYAEFFADDIPDEWSAAEREKSHNGVSNA